MLNFLTFQTPGYKAAAEAAHVQHAEKMKEREYKASLKETYQETFDYDPRRVKQNEELFEASRKK